MDDEVNFGFPLLLNTNPPLMELLPSALQSAAEQVQVYSSLPSANNNFLSNELNDENFGALQGPKPIKNAFLDESSTLALGQSFINMKDAKVYVKSFLEKNEIHYAVLKSCGRRFLLTCPISPKACSFSLAIFNRLKQGIVLHSLNFSHDCGLTDGVPRISKSTCIELLKGAILDNNKEPLLSLVNSLQRNHGKAISYLKAWKVKDAVLKSLGHDSRKSFSLLQSFFDKAGYYMSGSVGLIRSDANQKFLNSFFLLSASKNALSFCRPMLVLDACHIKNEFKGIIMAAVAYDGNGQLVPIAIGTGNIENKENWTWFLENLKTHLDFSSISLQSNWFTFMSDRDKGLIPSLDLVFPEVHHANCVRHILRNLKLKFQKDLSRLVFKASKAKTTGVFNSAMDEIKEADSQYHAHLSSIGYLSWSQFYSPAPCFNVVTSNLVECFNSWIESL